MFRTRCVSVWSKARQSMGVDETQDGTDGGEPERLLGHSVQANEHPKREEGRTMPPVEHQQLTDEQGYSDFIPDQPSEDGDLDRTRTSQSDSSMRSSGSWRRSGQFLRTNSQNGKDPKSPNWRQRLQSTLSPRNSGASAKRAAPPSRVGEASGETGDVAAQLTALTSKIAELQVEVARLQNEPSGESRPASPYTKPVATRAQPTASRDPQPEPPPDHQATPSKPAEPPPKTPEGAGPTSHGNVMTRTSSASVHRIGCLPPAADGSQKLTAVSIVQNAARFLTEGGRHGLYWIITRLGDGVGHMSRVAQYGPAPDTGNEVEDEEPAAIEYEEWELVNGKPTLAARRWREEHGPVAARRKGKGNLCIAPRKSALLTNRGGGETNEWEPWELVDGKPTLAALRMREEEGGPTAVRHEPATPMRPKLETQAPRSSSRHSPLLTTARAVAAGDNSPKTPARNARASTPTQQAVSAVWVDAVVSTSEPSTSSHSPSSAGADAPKPSNA